MSALDWVWFGLGLALSGGMAALAAWFWLREEARALDLWRERFEARHDSNADCGTRSPERPDDACPCGRAGEAEHRPNCLYHSRWAKGGRQ